MPDDLVMRDFASWDGPVNCRNKPIYIGAKALTVVYVKGVSVREPGDFSGEVVLGDH